MTRKTGNIEHINLVDSWDYKEGHTIFCKRIDRIRCINPETDCLDCPHFRGTGQGECVACQWVDVYGYGAQYDTKVVPYFTVNNELKRVTRLIDQGIVKRG